MQDPPPKSITADVDRFLTGLDQVRDYAEFIHMAQGFDTTVAKRCQSNKPLYRHHLSLNLAEIKSAIQVSLRPQPLDIPTQKDLTDAFLRNSLGHQQKLISSYVELFDKNNARNSAEAVAKQNKERFRPGFTDFYATSRAQAPAIPNPFESGQRRAKPVMDSERAQFQKTQLLYLQKPKQLMTGTMHHELKLQVIQNKLEQTGGIQNTLRAMEQSLNAFQIGRSSCGTSNNVAGIAPATAGLSKLLEDSRQRRAAI